MSVTLAGFSVFPGSGVQYSPNEESLIGSHCPRLGGDRVAEPVSQASLLKGLAALATWALAGNQKFPPQCLPGLRHVAREGVLL